MHNSSTHFQSHIWILLHLQHISRSQDHNNLGYGSNLRYRHEYASSHDTWRRGTTVCTLPPCWLRFNDATPFRVGFYPRSPARIIGLVGWQNASADGSCSVCSPGMVYDGNCCLSNTVGLNHNPNFSLIKPMKQLADYYYMVTICCVITRGGCLWPGCWNSDNNDYLIFPQAIGSLTATKWHDWYILVLPCILKSGFL